MPRIGIGDLVGKPLCLPLEQFGNRYDQICLDHRRISPRAALAHTMLKPPLTLMT